jgi:hypothetical protein
MLRMVRVVHAPAMGQISRVVSLTLAGVALTALIEVPPHTLPLIVLDSPLTLRLAAPWVVAPVLVTLAAAGTDWLVRLGGRDANSPYLATMPSWMIPGVIAGAAPFLATRFSAGSPPWWIVLASAGVGLFAALLAEATAGSADASSQRARLALAALTYSVALVVFTAIYSTHIRTVVSGVGVTLVALLLAVALLRWSLDGVGRWALAGAVGLAVGIVMWRLNHTAVETPVAGGLLLLTFYVVVGLAQHVAERTLDRQAVIEIVIAAGAALLLLLGLGRSGG